MEMHKEALLNARNTIILVAVFITTVTFAAGIAPPGGVYQEGPMKGKSGDIIPFKKKPHMRLLSIAHKVMWVAIAFMASGYVIAIWVILPHSEGMQWLSVMLIALGGSSLGTIFIGLSMLLVEHWPRKFK
ncbi:hypothetical protein Ahy_B01g055813 [Arachis hypogaea]|uniref:PGG domain-containing protein n=1 Tax=Arachis hypogaea TaxID=3818 RepID=A0A445AX70_ARAHY|nr:hypothetical protein Ahy_B01g055813 [Arachis hypogaea]